MTTRRQFIQQGLGYGVGALSLPALLGMARVPSKPPASLGLQVYSLREQLKADFTGTLKRVAEIGYREIEAYGLGKDGKFLGKVAPAEYRKICEEHGLRMVATHGWHCKPEEAQVFIEAAQEAGADYLIVPWLAPELRKSADSYKQVAETLNEVGAMARAAGLKYGYHNHAFEFEKVDGQIPMEILIEETDPENVTFELDLFWITKGGLDPVAFIKKHTGRFSCFHVKDASKDLKAETVGQGIIDFETIFAANRKYLRHYFVEDERTNSPFENVQAAYDYLTAKKFV